MFQVVYVNVGEKTGKQITYRVAQKIWHNSFYTLTLPNINRFSQWFHCQNLEKICNNTITEDQITPQVFCCTLPCEMLLSGAKCHGFSLITLLVSGIAAMWTH